MFHEKAKTLPIFGYYLILVCCLEIDKVLGPYAVQYLFDVFQTTAVHHMNAGYLLNQYGPYAWDPMLFSGLPAQLAGIHPWGIRSIALIVMPAWLVQDIMHLLLLSIGGYGLFRMLTEYFYCNRIVAHIVAVLITILSTGGMAIVAIPHVFPLLFMWLRDISLGRNVIWIQILKGMGATLLSTVTICVFVIPYYMPFSFILLFFLSDGRGNYRRFLFLTVLYWIGYIAYYSPVVWSLYDFLPNVYRDSEYIFPGVGIAIISTLKAMLGIFSNAYGVLCLGVVFLYKGNSRQQTIFWLFIIFTVLIGFTHSEFYDLLRGTILHKGHLYRMQMLQPVVLAITAGVVLHFFWKQQRSLLFLAPFAVLPWLYLNEENAIINTLLLFSALLVYEVSISKANKFQWKKATMLGVVTLLVFFSVLQIKQQRLLQEDAQDFYAQGFGNHSSLDAISELAKKEVFRVASIDLHPSIVKSYNVETIDAKDELIYHNYSRAIAELQVKQYKNRQESIDRVKNDQLLLFTTRVPNTKYSIHHSYNDGVERSIDDLNVPMMIAMNVKYLVSANPIVGIEKYGKLVQKDQGKGLPWPLHNTYLNKEYELPLWIYELSTFPRAYYVPALTEKKNTDEVFISMGTSSIQEFRDQAFIDINDPVNAPVVKRAPPEKVKISNAHSVNITEYSPDSFVLEVATDTAGYVVISNNFDKRWHAELNGTPVPILRVNGYMQGVPILQKGVFSLEMTYRNPVYWILQQLSIVGLLLMIAVPFLGARSSTYETFEIENHVITVKPREFHLGWYIGLLLFWLIFSYLFKFSKVDQVKPIIYAVWVSPVAAFASIAWVRKGFQILSKK